MNSDAGQFRHLAKPTDFLQEIKILPGLPTVHPTLFHVGPGTHRHCGADGVKGIRETDELLCQHVIAKVQFVGGDSVEYRLAGRCIDEAKRGPFTGVKRMLEVDTGPGRIWLHGEVRLDAGEVIGRTTAVGVVADEQTVLRLANVGKPPQRLVHPDLARLANAGVLRWQIEQLQQVDGQPSVAALAQPVRGLVEAVLILTGYLERIFFGAVDDNDHLRLAKWWLAGGQALQCANKVRLVMAGYDDDHPQSGVRLGLDQPWAGRFPQVLFVRCSHLASGQSGVFWPLVQWNTTVAGGLASLAGRVRRLAGH